jgi:ABC-type uncharacterized transport system substrate-binding protein
MRINQFGRRAFISLLSSAAAWPLAARAQQPAMPVIGYLSGFSSTAFPPYLAAFRDGLNATGYVEGRNVAIEYRWAESEYDRLPGLAADLVRRKVTLIVATGVTASPVAAKAATTTIPIVFLTGGDPIKLGLVSSFNRPDGNLTGVTWLSNTMAAKRMELLRELMPGATTIGLLVNPAKSKCLVRDDRRAGSSARTWAADTCRECQQRTRYRRGLCRFCSSARQCDLHWWRSILHQPASSSGGPGGTTRDTHKS